MAILSANWLIFMDEVTSNCRWQLCTTAFMCARALNSENTSIYFFPALLQVFFFCFAKGQLISKCPYEKSVWTKLPTKIFPIFLSWKFTTSRLTQKESLCTVCKKIDSVFTVN